MNSPTGHPLDSFRLCPRCGAEFSVDTEKSKRCSGCGFEFFLNASASTVAVILDGHGRLLCVRRAKEPARGTLDLPGGFCDIGETAEEGLRREVREETGLTVASARYLFSLPNLYRYSGLDVPTLDLFFLCTTETAEEAVAMDDAAEALWLPLSEVRPEDFGLASISQGIRRLKAMPDALHP